MRQNATDCVNGRVTGFNLRPIRPEAVPASIEELTQGNYNALVFFHSRGNVPNFRRNARVNELVSE
jgi:hypothetical protein